MYNEGYIIKQRKVQNITFLLFPLLSMHLFNIIFSIFIFIYLLFFIQLTIIYLFLLMIRFNPISVTCGKTIFDLTLYGKFVP